MANGTPQSFANHVVLPKTWLQALGVMLLALITAVIGALNAGGPAGTILVGVAVALLALASAYGLFVVRGYATKLQDRIIRTEMRLRLAAVLPEDLRNRITDLTLRQLIALRFAADEELPDLVRKVLADNLQEATAVKRLVKNWQGDYVRV